MTRKPKRPFWLEVDLSKTELVTIAKAAGVKIVWARDGGWNEAEGDEGKLEAFVLAEAMAKAKFLNRR